MALAVILFIVMWLGAVLAGYMFWTARRSADVDRIKNRLMGGGEADQKRAARKGPAPMQAEDKRTGRLVLELLRRYQVKERLGELIEQAGLKWHPGRLLHGCMALFLAGAALGLSALSPAYRAWALLPGAVLGVAPLLYVSRKRRLRLRKFEEQFPESLDFIARSMRAGHAFSVSLEMVHNEFQEPLAGEFRRAFDEQNLGLPLDTALEKMARRVPSMDVHFFVSAVLLQKRTGGNLAELLEKLAGLIRERFKLRGRIRAISAHGRMTGTVLSLIPASVALIMFYVNPDYIMFFIEDSLGHMMAGGAIVMQFLGFAIIKKIVTIEA
jgi:tight adherence protein B